MSATTFVNEGDVFELNITSGSATSAVSTPDRVYLPPPSQLWWKENERAALDSRRAQTSPVLSTHKIKAPAMSAITRRRPRLADDEEAAISSYQVQTVLKAPETEETASPRSDYDAFYAKISGSAARCVFLITGPANDCRVIQILLKDDDEDDVVFAKMKESWKKSRHWALFRRVAKVEEVKVSSHHTYCFVLGCHCGHGVRLIRFTSFGCLAKAVM